MSSESEDNTEPEISEEDFEALKHQKHDDIEVYDRSDKRRKLSDIERQIQWRRAKVAEYDAKDFTQQDIATILKVSTTTVNRDLQWLREQAAETIKTYTTTILPHLFNKSIKGLGQIQREAWLTSANTKYERNKILALSLAKDCIQAKVDMATSADVIDKTALFVTRKRKALEQLEADEEEYNELPYPTPPNTDSPLAEAEPEQEEREILHPT